MDRFVVRSSGPLSGEVRVQGAKNSALKLMAACLLTKGTSRLENVPAISDVVIMSEVLSAIGASVERQAGSETPERAPALLINVPERCTPVAPYELVEKMRASFVVLGPLLARHGAASVSLPGGDDFGSRPIDMHLRALGALGVEFTTEHGYVEGRCDRLTGARVVLEYPSHTTTDNVLMAATLAKGTTVIENAACEPEVQDLAALLSAMGARISGAGTSRIEVEGVDELHPATHVTVADRVEAATFFAAVGLAGGDVHVLGARDDHMDMLLEKLTLMGMELEATGRGVRARFEGRLAPVDVATLPYPGVATDYKPLLVTMLSVSTGVAIVSENLFAGRFRYVDELRRMGADVRTEGHHAVVRGVERLSGAPVRAPDIRAGAALVLAGLAADGMTTVSGTEHIERGYEDFVGKLRAIGVDITRVAAGPDAGA
ncbi:MAG: UDP-N-acetylglucosamine 1-carboxyvinyltransferase [Acidimicrobiaceae bacterium]|nr:UDP-N-acetylglucosamine 1-carboxyvinyltransferase [Acidimicrobiaceae bacterium]